MLEKVEFKTGVSTVVASTTRTFETQRDLVTAVENKWGASTTLSKYEHEYDDLARRKHVITTGVAFNFDRFTLFTYNDRSELLTSKRYNGSNVTDTSSPVLAQHYTFAFDPIGNRTSYTGENPPLTTSYTSNNLNQYTLIDEHSVPDWSPSYDADGNVIQDDQYDYTWDAANQLASVTPRAVITGSKKCVFTYDYMGRRARKQVYTYSSGQWGSTPSTDLKCIDDGWNLILELNGLNNDAVLRQYTWGLDLSGQAGNVIPPVGASAIPGMHAAGGIGGLLAMRDAGTSTDLLYLYDANGNVGQLIKTSDGSFGAKYQYYPYGGEIQAVGTYATVNPFRFSTKYWDTEHQALYYGYRYHKPKLGRWLSRDPSGERGGLNPFALAGNDPIGLFDPLGLQPTASSQACGCGPDVTNWFMVELQMYLDEVAKSLFIKDYRVFNETNAVEKRAILLSALRKLALSADHKERARQLGHFKSQDCPTSGDCVETVTLCGKTCVGVHQLGNIIYGVLAHQLDVVDDARAYGRGNHELARMMGAKGPAVPWTKEPYREAAFDFGISLGEWYDYYSQHNPVWEAFTLAGGGNRPRTNLFCGQLEAWAKQITGSSKDCVPCKTAWDGPHVDFSKKPLVDESGNRPGETK